MSSLTGKDLGPRGDMLHSVRKQVTTRPTRLRVDLYKFVRQFIAPGLFVGCLRVVNHLAFTLLPNHYNGEAYSDIGSSRECYSRHTYIPNGALSESICTQSCAANVSNLGVTYIIFSIQACRLYKGPYYHNEVVSSRLQIVKNILQSIRSILALRSY